MSIVTYPDGSSLSSTALTNAEIQTAMQVATCGMLGLLADPFDVEFTLTTGQASASATNVNNLYSGLVVSCTGLLVGTEIIGVGPGNTVTFNNAATITGVEDGTVVDPNAFALVRLEWQQQGQPGWGVNDDVCFVRCVPVDADFSKQRDITNTAGATTITQTDVFTRAWQTFWCFYGPNSLDHARAVRSALVKIDYFADLLAANNLYVNPSINEPIRLPEEYQGQWWERVDLAALFNEQITETYVVNAVASVEVIGSTSAGEFTDFTTAP